MAAEGALEALRTFLTTFLEHALADAGSAAAERQAVVLFHRVAATVPAYRTFLREHRIDPGQPRAAGHLARADDPHYFPAGVKHRYTRSSGASAVSCR